MRRSTIAIALGVLALGSTASATAFAFGATVCNPGDLPLYWTPTGLEGTRFALPQDQNYVAPTGSPYVPAIANDTFYYAGIRANRRVSTVSFHFRDTNLDIGDSVSFPFLNNNISYTNLAGAWFWTPAFANSGSYAGWSAPFNIQMDATKSILGVPPNMFTIDTARVTCLPEAPSPGESEAWVEKKNIGILTGSNDVLYYSYPAPPNNPFVGQTYHLHVALNYEGPTVDFDLYARCGAFPTASSFDYRGYSGSHQEFLDITAPCATRWYFAVNSYSGAGVFDLTVGEGGDEAFCFAFTNDFTGPQKVDASSQIITGMKAFFGATLGGILPDQLIFMNGDANSQCTRRPGGPPGRIDALITAESGSSSSPMPNSAAPIIFRSDFWTFTNGTPTFSLVPFVVSHEMSHHYFGTPDEYKNGGDGCGHSLLGSPVARDFIGYCTSSNHGRDPVTGASYVDPGNPDYSVPPYGNAVSMWEKLAYNQYNRPINFTLAPASPRMRPVNTVENYSYRTFNFNTDAIHITPHYLF